MKSKFPRNVCLNNMYDKSIWYYFHCDCGESNHAATIELEVEDNIMCLRFYKDVYYAYYGDNIIKQWWHRIKGAVRLIFTGYLEVSESMIILHEEHIDNFIDALVEGRNYLVVRNGWTENHKRSSLVGGKLDSRNPICDIFWIIHIFL